MGIIGMRSHRLGTMFTTRRCWFIQDAGLGGDDGLRMVSEGKAISCISPRGNLKVHTGQGSMIHVQCQVLPLGIIVWISRTKLQVRRDHHGNKKHSRKPPRRQPASGDTTMSMNKKETENKNKVDIRPGKQTGRGCAANKRWKSQFIVIRGTPLHSQR
jgi:hypothetical protein